MTTILESPSNHAPGGPGGHGGASPSEDERIALLRRTVLFHELTPAQLQPVAAATQVVTFKAGDYLMRQGDPGDSVFIISSGRVEILADDPDRSDDPGASVVISSLSSGDTVGELALLDGRPRSASCVALGQTRCLRLERHAFLEAARRHWSLSRALFAVLADRLRYADARMAEHAHDPLTGLHNRRSLVEIYERERARAERVAREHAQRGGTGAPHNNRLALLFVDVNQFKTINDTYGHLVGDEVLCAVARTLRHAVRASDLVARYGGDEFVVLMPESSKAGAEHVCTRMRLLFQEMTGPHAQPVPYTVSVGLAVSDAFHPPALEELMAAADAAMYRDKEKQR
ncbi:MAG TPA: GGDEF domain-containing protein [Chloroflexota bacterium]|nr:GGDEF domain-containing protein [Chloroflexota bacterium]